MSAALLEKVSATAENYRRPMQITHVRKFCNSVYYICPRCNVTMEREFMAYCDRCGQHLNWKTCRKAVVLTE